MNDETNDSFERRVELWVARVLQVEVGQIESVETDWGPNCDTCEYSWGQIEIKLTDGRKFVGEKDFGGYLREIVYFDLNEDGTLSEYADNTELFELEPR